MNHYLHPSPLDLTELADRDQMAAYLHAPYPSERYLESFATAGPFGRPRLLVQLLAGASTSDDRAIRKSPSVRVEIPHL